MPLIPGAEHLSYLIFIDGIQLWEDDSYLHLPFITNEQTETDTSIIARHD